MKHLERLREIFIKASEIATSEQRNRFLDQSCGEDVSLRGQVETLLASEAQVGGPPEPDKITRDSIAPGAVLGNCKILEQLGEGGCGVVYRAQQKGPFVRDVAIKVIKRGMDTRQVVARFEAERQVLALMKHPHIASVYDGGSTTDGRPFFVMELVLGSWVTRFCDEHRFDVRKRLELFLRVCQAVQHAHQNGVIHRDLKPSNILVTQVDDRPVPKVIDFGIAKAIAGRLTESTFMTSTEQLLGTPDYMSPEQAAKREKGIDTRSDVYSLGAILYELIAGKPLFDVKGLLDSGLDSMRHAICHKPPKRPSQRLAESDDAPLKTIAQLRNASSEHLIRMIRSDLDWIILKCLEKDPSRRYATVNGLAMDLERYLQSRPIVARPPSIAYAVGKSISRHKAAFLAGSIAVIGILAAGRFAGMQYVAKSRALARAMAAEQTQDTLRRSAVDALRASLVHQGRLATELKKAGVALDAFSQAASIQPSGDLIESSLTAMTIQEIASLGEWVPGDIRQARVAMHPSFSRYMRYQGEAQALEIYHTQSNEVVQSIPLKGQRHWKYAAWLADGMAIAGYDASGRLEVWDLSDESLRWERLDPGSAPDRAFDAGRLAIDPKGELLSIIDASGGLDLVEPNHGAVQKRFRFEHSITCSAFHPIDRWLAIGSEKEIVVFNLESGEEVGRKFTNHAVRHLAWSPDGRTLAAQVSGFGFLRWDPQYHEEKLIEGSAGYYARSCYSPDGRWIAESDGDGSLNIRHPKSGFVIASGLNGIPLQFDDSSRRLICRGGSGGIVAYELPQGEGFVEFEVPFWGDSSLPGVCVSPNDRWVATTSFSAGLFVWDLERGGKPEWNYSFKCSSIAFSHAGDQLLSCSEDGIYRWNWNPSHARYPLNGPTRIADAVVENSRRMSKSYSDPSYLMIPSESHIWMINRHDFTDFQTLPGEHPESVALFPNAQNYVTSSFFEPIRMRNVDFPNEIGYPTKDAGLLAISPDGSMVTIGRAGSITARSARDWKLLWRLETQTINDSSGHCAFRPQGDLLATLASPQELILARPSDGRALLRLRTHRPGPINRYAFSDSGRLLAVSLEDGRVQVWRLNVLQEGLLEMGLDWRNELQMPDLLAE